ncbi:MAG: hypothetical protein DRH03_02760 [Deltaproteobacteria bacterium]|nr:MAG: hypothetical protein DRH03_02760 [Deltaproteobacteria bacterium]
MQVPFLQAGENWTVFLLAVKLCSGILVDFYPTDDVKGLLSFVFELKLLLLLTVVSFVCRKKNLIVR